ncbi:MAG: glycosyltransferase family 2 protein [Rudaea sp.]
MNTTSTPLITTVIPTYRRPKLLRRAIESALGQEGVPLTVCVFDNASGDETCAVVTDIAASDARLKYHCHETNLGAAANFEFGMRSVTTPFFSILSDDDYLLPGFYKHALDDLAQHPDAMFWAGVTLNVNEEGQIWDAKVDHWTREGKFAPPAGLMAMMHGMAPTWTGTVFRREVLDQVGFLDREAVGPSDLDYTLRVAARYPFIVRKHPSAVFTLNAESFSATQPLSSFWPGWQKMFLNLRAISELDELSKGKALDALHQDAQRMLFRRGAYALSRAHYQFARDAAETLYTQYGRGYSRFILKAIAFACERAPWLQRTYAFAYRATERRLVKSRGDFESRFGHLIRRSG